MSIFKGPEDNDFKGLEDNKRGANVFKGKTFMSVVQTDRDEIIFTTKADNKFKMYHDQDCCEMVYIEEINGDLAHLVDSEILSVKENSADAGGEDSSTRTTYTLTTAKGTVEIVWLGESNGYYSEGVNIVEV
jgi:hypothetical protein